MKSPSETSSAKVSVGEIASLAGVRPSAVSNWRTRHADFPSPAERSAGGDLFDLQTVTKWLSDHGKNRGAPRAAGESLYDLVGAKLRESGQLIDHSVLIILQVLYVRMATARSHPLRLQLSPLWEHLASTDDPVRMWQEEINKLSSSSELARVLELPSGTDPCDIQAACEFVAAISEIGASPGELATSILRHYEEWQGLRGSAGVTQDQLTRLIAGLLEPFDGVVYDPAAGLAMILAEAWRRRTSDDVRLLGQDISEFNWKLGYLHLALYAANYELKTGDTLREDRFRSIRADRIAADPPFGSQRGWSDQLKDERWQFGASWKSPEWLWAQHVLFHLNDTGVGVLAVSPAALSKSGKDASTRMELAESGFLDAVVELPQGMVAGSSVGVALLVFSKSRRNREDQILFVNARQLGKPRRGKSHELSNEEIGHIQAAFAAWRLGVFKPEPLFTASARIEQIRQNKADLAPQRYVSYVTSISQPERADTRARLSQSITEFSHSAQNSNRFVESIERAINALAPSDSVKQNIVKLGDILRASPQPGSRQNLKGHGRQLPYVQTNLVSGGSAHLRKAPEDITYDTPHARIAARGDLLLVSRGLSPSNGGCSIVDFDGGAGYAQSLVKLSTDSQKVDPDYLRIYLTSTQGRNAIAAATTGSVIGNLRAEALQQIEIPLPSLAIQRKITEAVNRLEDGITGVEKLLKASTHVLDVLRDAAAAGVVSPSPSPS